LLKDLTDVIRTYTCRRHLNIVWQKCQVYCAENLTSVIVLYKKVTSVIRCCQTNSDTIGTCGTCGTSGTSLEEHVVLVVLQVHGHCNLIGNAKQHHKSLPVVSI